MIDGPGKRVAVLGGSDQATMSQEKANCMTKLGQVDLPGKGGGMLSSLVASKVSCRRPFLI